MSQVVQVPGGDGQSYTYLDNGSGVLQPVRLKPGLNMITDAQGKVSFIYVTPVQGGPTQPAGHSLSTLY